MSIADRIAVMDHAKIEQIGGPAELYDQPASRFVMGFLGEISQLGDELVRPHDIAISSSSENGGHEAVVTRATLLGFEVRVELMLTDGSSVSAQLTRSEADELELSSGDIVWLRSTGASALPSDEAAAAPPAPVPTDPVG